MISITRVGNDSLKPTMLKVRPIARLGYFDYTSVDTVFTMKPEGPGNESLLAGLEGRPRDLPET